MDYQIPLFFSITCLCLYFLKMYIPSKINPTKLPPGPKPWPIIGNILQISENPHQSMTRLSKIYGPLMTLHLGSVTTVVVSSADMAREVFQKHDLSFSSRKIPLTTHSLSHHEHSMIFLPVSDKWRTLRKISALHLFAKKSLDVTELVRQEKVHELVEHVSVCCRNGEAVEIGKIAFTTLLNLLSNTIFGTNFGEQSSPELSQEFMGIILASMEAIGKPSLADHFPVLGYFDRFRTRRDGEDYTRKSFAILDGIIQQRLSGDPHSFDSEKGDFLATLLKITKEDGSNLSLDDIKHLIVDLFLAGTDTAAATFEWAMSELLKNPTKMLKLEAELDQINAPITESDIAKLPYLQAVIKETFRLHPPAPFLIPHKANKDVNFRGYIIPSNTQLLVNVWAIGRDPDTWLSPELFSPERFLESEIDFKGRDFELMPFGAGRRMCPGIPLATRMLQMMLGSVVKGFKWEVVGGEVDMTEKFGLVVHRAKPLFAVPIAK